MAAADLARGCYGAGIAAACPFTPSIGFPSLLYFPFILYSLFPSSSVTKGRTNEERTNINIMDALDQALNQGSRKSLDKVAVVPQQEERVPSAAARPTTSASNKRPTSNPTALSNSTLKTSSNAIVKTSSIAALKASSNSALKTSIVAAEDPTPAPAPPVAVTLPPVTHSAEAIDFPRILRLFTSHHSRYLFDRHLAVLQKFIQIFTKDTSIQDYLTPLSSVLQHTGDRIEDGGKELVAPLLQLLEMIS